MTKTAWTALFSTLELLSALAKVALFISFGWLLDQLLSAKFCADAHPANSLSLSFGCGASSQVLFFSAALIAAIVLLNLATGFAHTHAVKQFTTELEHPAFSALLSRNFQQDALGETVIGATDGIESLAKNRVQQLSDFAAFYLSPPVILAGIWQLAGALSAVIILLTWLAVMGLSMLVGKAVRKQSIDYRKEVGQFANLFQESIRSLTDLRTLGAQARRGLMIRAAAERVRKEVMGLLARNQLVLILNDISFAIVFAAAVATVIFGWGSIFSSAGTVLSFLVLVYLFRDVSGALTKLRNTKRFGQPMQAKYASLFSDPEHSGSRPGHPNQQPNPGLAATQPERGSNSAVNPIELEPDSSTQSETVAPAKRTNPALLEVQNLSVVRDRRNVIKSASFSLERGELIGIIGSTGSGKSTIAEVLQGLLAEQSGKIAVRGHILSAKRRPEQILLASQRSYLFRGSIRDNLLLAKPDADDRTLFEALAQAQIATEIAALPHGLDSQIGEDGGSLSGGQIQRLALARAFLANPDILIVDEPTSQLDPSSAEAIAKALALLKPGRGTIVITHHKTPLQQADRVLRLSDGTLTEVSADDVWRLV